ncbi:Uncharacterised protein [Candidatus Norongarragalina meridionalis]|nr:Uncharacterised protein [Candidatus Norongarragalina meridionalis]
MEEHKTNDTQGQTLLYAVAALALVFVIFAGYTLMQMNAISQKATSGNDTAILSRLSTLESRLSVLESTSDVKPVKILLFYDSSCEFCNNADVLSYFDGLANNLAAYRVTAQKIDVKGQETIATAYGIKRVPAMYASAGDVMNNKYLNAYLTQVLSSTTSGFSVSYPSNGNAIYFPQRTVVLGTGCSSSSKVSLEYFYSESCAACKRLTDADGFPVNPKGPNFEYVADEGVAEAQSRFGPLLSVEKRCVATSDADASKCATAVGEANFSAAQAKTAEYGTDAVPVAMPAFVVDCKYVFANMASPSGEAMEQNICAARPDVCAKLPKASPTAAPSVNATATPAASVPA